MHFLLDANLPNSAGDTIRASGHEATPSNLPGHLAIVEFGRVRLVPR